MGLREDTQNWLADLYDRHGAGVYRYLVVLLGRKEDAEDVMQTIFVKLARHPERKICVTGAISRSLIVGLE